MLCQLTGIKEYNAPSLAYMTILDYLSQWGGLGEAIRG